MRYEELDSIRGIASFSVLLGHFMLITQVSTATKMIEYGPLRLFVASGEAVVIFFILSGFVLSLPFLKDGKVKYTPFLLKRFFRIYLPLYVSLVVVIPLSIVFNNQTINGLSDWFNMIWQGNIDANLIVNHLLLITSFNNVHFNPALWSLVHEMRISILFPLLMIVVTRLNWRRTMVFSFVLSMTAFSIYLLLGKPNSDYIQSIHYSSLFILGAVLAKYRFLLVAKISLISNKRKFLLLLGGLFFYLYVKPAFALNIIFGSRDAFLATIIDSWTVGIGASAIILLALSYNMLSRFLLLKPVCFLGKISYSLYLYHIIVLLTFTHMMHGILSIWLIWSISLIASLLIATLSYYFVEKPSIKLGKLIKNKAHTASIETHLETTV